MVTVTQRAEAMLQQQHYNAELVRAIAENVTLAWQQLMYHAEERQKLVMASTNWYKTAEQVRSFKELTPFIDLSQPYYRRVCRVRNAVCEVSLTNILNALGRRERQTARESL